MKIKLPPITHTLLFTNRHGAPAGAWYCSRETANQDAELLRTRGVVDAATVRVLEGKRDVKGGCIA